MPTIDAASAATVEADADHEAHWALNPMQEGFVRCADRFSFYVGGIGAGKTFAGAVRSILRAFDYPRSLGLIGAPTYPMLRDVSHGT